MMTLKSITFFVAFLNLNFCVILVAGASNAADSKPISDYLRWKSAPVDPNCTGPMGGRNPCKDVRICDFAVASLMLGGWPTLCGWVGKGVPKVCCGIPLVFGEGLMKKVDAEKARSRQCGTKHFSKAVSPTEKKFFELKDNVPEIDISNPNSFDPPLELYTETMVSPVGGSPTRQGDFPWMVAIFKRRKFWCGAALIDRIHVLSAAHCFVTQSGRSEASDYTVRVGNIYVDLGYPFKIAKLRLHEDYVPATHYNDIAIITLETEILIPLAAHICLPDARIAGMDMTGKTTTLLGWGDDEFGGSNVPSLHIVDDLPVVSNKECRESYQHVGGRSLPKGITDQFICAGLQDGGKDACQQDSGGPLMYKDVQDNVPSFETPWVLVGIVSFGYGCGEPGFPGVYTRITSYMDWIAKNTADIRV